jgi:hypothetical protein
MSGGEQERAGEAAAPTPRMLFSQHGWADTNRMMLRFGQALGEPHDVVGWAEVRARYTGHEDLAPWVEVRDPRLPDPLFVRNSHCGIYARRLRSTDRPGHRRRGPAMDAGHL